MSDPNLAAEDAEVVGARVHASFLDRAQRGDHHVPSRPLYPPPSGDASIAEAKLQLLRTEFEAALAEIGSRLLAVGAKADAATARAEQAIAAGEALVQELSRLGEPLPPEVAAAVERFGDRLRTA